MFEYKVLSCKIKEMEKEINELAIQGWVVDKCTHVYGTFKCVVILKRTINS